MKLAFITNSLDVGGIETNLVRLTRQFTSRDHEVVVMSWGGELSHAIEDAGGELVRLQWDGRKPGTLIQDIRAVRDLARDGTDVIHVFSATTAVVTFLARCTCGARFPPVVSTIMGLQAAPTESAIVTHFRAWTTALGADALLLTSPAHATVARRLPMLRRRSVNQAVVGIDIPGHRDSTKVTQLRRELLGPTGTSVVMTIGRLASTKSHGLFLQAAEELAPLFPEVRFVLVGDGELRSILLAEITMRGLEDRVLMTGERHDVDDLLACADIYVRPGVVEGFIGITVLEAQAMRVPVVSFDTRDVRMAITPGVTGWLVEPNEPGGLARTLSALLSQEIATDAVVEKAYGQVVDVFSMERVAESLEWFYSSLVARTRKDGGRLRAKDNGRKPKRQPWSRRV